MSDWRETDEAVQRRAYLLNKRKRKSPLLYACLQLACTCSPRTHRKRSSSRRRKRKERLKRASSEQKRNPEETRPLYDGANTAHIPCSGTDEAESCINLAEGKGRILPLASAVVQLDARPLISNWLPFSSQYSCTCHFIVSDRTSHDDHHRQSRTVEYQYAVNMAWHGTEHGKWHKHLLACSREKTQNPINGSIALLPPRSTSTGCHG